MDISSQLPSSSDVSVNRLASQFRAALQDPDALRKAIIATIENQGHTDTPSQAQTEAERKENWHQYVLSFQGDTRALFADIIDTRVSAALANPSLAISEAIFEGLLANKTLLKKQLEVEKPRYMADLRAAVIQEIEQSPGGRIGFADQFETADAMQAAISSRVEALYYTCGGALGMYVAFKARLAAEAEVIEEETRALRASLLRDGFSVQQWAQNLPKSTQALAKFAGVMAAAAVGAGVYAALPEHVRDGMQHTMMEFINNVQQEIARDPNAAKSKLDKFQKIMQSSAGFEQHLHGDTPADITNLALIAVQMLSNSGAINGEALRDSLANSAKEGRVRIGDIVNTLHAHLGEGVASDIDPLKTLSRKAGGLSAASNIQVNLDAVQAYIPSGQTPQQMLDELRQSLNLEIHVATPKEKAIGLASAVVNSAWSVGTQPITLLRVSIHETLKSFGVRIPALEKAFDRVQQTITGAANHADALLRAQAAGISPEQNTEAGVLGVFTGADRNQTQAYALSNAQGLPGPALGGA